MKRSTTTLFEHHITRRDFLNGVLVGAGSALIGGGPTGTQAAAMPAGYPSLDPGWYGYGGVGDYRTSHGNTPDVVSTAHRIRDGEFATPPTRFASDEEYDLVIVGGGMAGLGAALEYTKLRQPGHTCLLLDNHPIFGGEAKENEFLVNGVTLFGPQGANGFFVPPKVDDPTQAEGDARYYAELGIPRDLPYREWPADDRPIKFCRDNYGYLVQGLWNRTSVGHFYPGEAGPGSRWAVDMWKNELADAPISEHKRAALLAWGYAGKQRSFADEPAAMRMLDRMSYKAFLERELKLDPAGSEYANLFLASAYGLGSDAVSAYAAYATGMPGLADPLGPEMVRNSFPGGNSGFARYFLKRIVPGAIAGGDDFADIVTGHIHFHALDRPDQPVRMRLSSTAVHVAHRGAPASSQGVDVIYTRGGDMHRARAKAVVMATGGWINRHVVKDLPDAHRQAYEQFRHAPFLVANVALTNWLFMYRLGISAALWDGSEDGFGYTCNIRQPMQVGRHRPPLDPEQPAVLSFYIPFFYPGLPIEQQVARGRAELLATSYAEYERRIRAQMLRLFGDSGFVADRDIAGIILNRWGHAYSVPFPGFFTGRDGAPAPRDVIRKHYGRIAFAHSELGGWQHWGPAADEGRRAVNQVFGAL